MSTQYARPLLARAFLSALQHNNPQRNTTNENTTKNKFPSFNPTIPTSNAPGNRTAEGVAGLPNTAHATTRTVNHTWFSLYPPAQEPATQHTTEQQPTTTKARLKPN